MAKTFDESELLERVDNDVAFLAETIDMLTTDGAGLVEEVRSAIAAGDAASLGRHAHALKGMISNFCASETQACAYDLEKMGKAGDLSTASAALSALEGRLASLVEELNQFVKAKS